MRLQQVWYCRGQTYLSRVRLRYILAEDGNEHTLYQPQRILIWTEIAIVDLPAQSATELAKHLVPLIMRLNKRITDDVAARLRPHGVTPLQFGLLCFLVKGSLTASELGQLMVVTSAAMTGIVDRLERDGLVERGSNPDDRRQSPISLTPQGRALVERLSAIPFEAAGQLGEGLAKMTGSERMNLDYLIRRLLIALGDQAFVEAAKANMDAAEVGLRSGQSAAGRPAR